MEHLGASTANGVDLVNEDNARRALASICKELTDLACNSAENINDRKQVYELRGKCRLCLEKVDRETDRDRERERGRQRDRQRQREREREREREGGRRQREETERDGFLVTKRPASKQTHSLVLDRHRRTFRETRSRTWRRRALEPGRRLHARAASCQCRAGLRELRPDNKLREG
jgi:hypothetical protein